MIEEILPNLYRMEIPLPRNPLKYLNSYLIKTPQRFLIIDTGMKREECLHEMQASLDMLSVDLNKTDFFITHIHSDHLGLTSSLVTSDSKVYFNEKEAAMVNSENKDEAFNSAAEFYKTNGFPTVEMNKVMASHPGRIYSSDKRLDYIVLKDRDTLEFGDYRFQVMETPGHSPGHLCLYEPEKKMLIAGDTILFDITPNISTWLGFKNPLDNYLKSLERLYDLDVNIVLPGHRSVSGDHRKRIDELKAHHDARLNEVLSALEDGDKNAYQIAACISWDINYSSWELFPLVPKIFAIGETIAHLEYLEMKEMIGKRSDNGIIIYSLM